MLYLHSQGASLLGVSGDHLSAVLFGALTVPLVFLFRRAYPARLPLDPRDGLVALSLAGSGMIHLGLVPGHLVDAPFESILFAGDALLLLGLATLGARRRHFRLAAALLLAANILAYGAYVAAGREQVDDAGALSKLVEIFGLGAALLPRQAGAGRLAAAIAGTLAATVVGGLLPWVGVVRDHGGAIVQAANATPTAADRQAALAFATQTWADIQPYRDWDAARRAGYRATTPMTQATFHATNDRFQKAADRAGGRLDPAHPPSLVYASTPRGPVLLGAMFQLPYGARGEDFAGAVDGWHSHPNACISPLTLSLSGLLTPFGNCPPLSFNWSSPKMLHVWNPAMPGGPFGDVNEAWVRQLRATAGAAA